MEPVVSKATAVLCAAEPGVQRLLLSSAPQCLRAATPDGLLLARCFAQAALQQAQPCADLLLKQPRRGSGSSSTSARDSSRDSSSGKNSGTRASISPSHTPKLIFGSSSGPQHAVHNSISRGKQTDLGDLSQQLQVWQTVAQLSPHAAKQLLEQYPPLQSRLRVARNFQLTNYFANLACLALHPGELASDSHAALRGVLALLSPSMLAASLERHSLLRCVLGQYHQQRATQQQPGSLQHHTALGQLQELLLSVCGPVRTPRQQQQQQQQQSQHQQQHHTGLQLWPNQLLQQQHGGQPPACSSRQSQQQQPQHQQSSHNFRQVAEAVVSALGLHPDHPPDNDRLLQQQDWANTRGCGNPTTSNSSSSSSSSTPSSPSAASSSSSSFSTPTRHYGTAATALAQAPNKATDLASALEKTAKSVALRSKPLHGAPAAADLAQQLQQATGLGGDDILQLLCARPWLLWQHKTPDPPQQLLQHLQDLLPGLRQPQGLARLVQQQPALLSCSSRHLQDAVDVLVGRLQLAPDAAAQLVLRHPQLLVRPAKSVLPNVGFLVGLGFRLCDLRDMAVKSPQWLTGSLRDLTVQWHFLQQVLKSSRQDVVLFPQLLSLPITSCLGPRVLYARKRQVKLLAPSLSALLGREHGSTAAACAEWRSHRVVPLEFWLSASDKRICSTMELNLEDYKRFKAAWARVDGANWQRYCLNNKRGGRQLVLSGSLLN